MQLTVNGYESAEVYREIASFLQAMARIKEDDEQIQTYQMKLSQREDRQEHPLDAGAGSGEQIVAAHQTSQGLTKKRTRKTPPVEATTEPTPEPIAGELPPSEDKTEAPFDGGIEVADAPAADISAPTVSLEQVRAVLVKLSQAGHAERSKALIRGYGVNSLSELAGNNTALAQLYERANKELESPNE